MTRRSQEPAPARRLPRLAATVVAVVSCRLLLNTARRFAYPFAPVLSRGIGVPLTAFTSIIAVNQATTLLGMFFGPLADRLGYRLMMLSGLGLLTVGMFLGGILPFYAVVMAGLFLSGLGKSVFDPAYQAYFGEKVPYHRRGMVIGFVEMSWAGSTLVGIPLLAVLMDRLGWRAPFFVLGGLGIVGMAAICLFIPGDANASPERARILDFSRSWRPLLRQRTALGAFGFAFFASIANDNLFVVYGAWLESAFHLSIVAIGIGTSLIGAAELCGELLTVAAADRFGLKRSVFTGLGLSVLAYGLLPLWGRALLPALVGLFSIFFVLEFTIVSFLSLCTELQPNSRATMMAGFFAAGGLGRIIGALIGGPIWLAGGITATATVSAFISTLALGSVFWGLKRWRR
ncbi:MAG: MFS transporter [Thermodesulfobacteriota bacterium]